MSKSKMLKVNLSEITEAEIVRFCEGNYYSDIDTKQVCSTFEGLPQSEIDEMIEIEVNALKSLLKIEDGE